MIQHDNCFIFDSNSCSRVNNWTLYIVYMYILGIVCVCSVCLVCDGDWLGIIYIYIYIYIYTCDWTLRCSVEWVTCRPTDRWTEYCSPWNCWTCQSHRSPSLLCYMCVYSDYEWWYFTIGYVYMCVCTYMCMCVYIYIYIHVCMCVNIDVYVCVCGG